MSTLLPPMDRSHSMSYESMSSLSDFSEVNLPRPPLALRPHLVRKNIRSVLYEHRYSSILDQRMSHIPQPLPFPRDEIISKLKNKDQTSPDWNRNSKLFDLDTDSTLLLQELDAPISQQKRRNERLRGRLTKIWGFLTILRKRIGLIGEQRLGRLRFNSQVFLQSDFPPSYLIALGESTYWELAAHNLAFDLEGQRITNRILGRATENVSKDSFLQSDASLQQIDTAYRNFHRNTSQTTLLADKVLEWRDAMEYYVDLYSARNLSQFRVMRPISMNMLNPSVMKRLEDGLREVTTELREKLNAQYQKDLWRVQWSPPSDPYIAGLIQLELEAT